MVDKNLYAYCDGNPVMSKDSSGEFPVAAIPLLAVPGAGEVLFAVAVVAIVTYSVYETYQAYNNYYNAKSKKKSKANPYARPGEYKQNRERRYKAREGKNWYNKSNPKPINKHTPGRGHKHK